jgi:hypothetical protein
MQIKPIGTIFHFAGLIITAGLVACANAGNGQQHEQHHAEQGASANQSVSSGASSSTGGMMGKGMTESGAGCPMMGCGAMDKEAACRMYRSMGDAPNEQERQAMMERYLQGMSPEMRQRHMEMMRQQCQ